MIVSTDPAPSALLAAIDWATGLLLGSIGTAIAVLAIAGLGFALMAGRLHARRAAILIIGCFVLVGAPTIARGLISFATSGPGRGEQAETPPPPVASTPPPFDPYAGASVPGH
jgi:type IV secretory pathway VirB2 component (pilin)